MGNYTDYIEHELKTMRRTGEVDDDTVIVVIADYSVADAVFADCKAIGFSQVHVRMNVANVMKFELGKAEFFNVLEVADHAEIEN